MLKRKEDNSDTEESLELIANVSTNSIALINDLLQEKRSLKERHDEMVDMRQLLEYCVTLLQTKPGDKSQQLTLHAEAITIFGNRQKIWRVISNILNNAIEFSPKGNLIQVILKKQNKTLLLSVLYNWIGIPEGLKEKKISIIHMSPAWDTGGRISRTETCHFQNNCRRA